MTTIDPQVAGTNADVSVGEARAFGRDADLVYPACTARRAGSTFGFRRAW